MKIYYSSTLHATIGNAHFKVFHRSEGYTFKTFLKIFHVMFKRRFAYSVCVIRWKSACSASEIHILTALPVYASYDRSLSSTIPPCHSSITPFFHSSFLPVTSR